MSGTELANEGVLRGVAKLLGLPDVAALSEVKPSGLWRLTQRELLDVAKTLGLTKVSRLKKEALLARIWEELSNAGAGTDVSALADLGKSSKSAPTRSTTAPAAMPGNGTATHVHPIASPPPVNVVGPPVAAPARPAVAKPVSVPDATARAPQAPAAPTVPAAPTGPTPMLAPARPSPQDTRESRPGAAHKFDVGEGEEADLTKLRAESEMSIPWGYGRDRITALPVDPDRLYAYWEVTDEAIVKARAGLGAGGGSAYLCLRLYDITGRIFDGTNAHGYTDHGIDRGQRQWFFHVGKPTSEALVEIGMKSHEGYFVKVARSGRISFPRKEPVFGGEPEWMTVRVSTGDVEGVGTGMAGGVATGAAPGGGAQAGFAGVPTDAQYFPEGFADLRRFLWGGRSEGESFPTHFLRWEEIAETEIDAEVVRSWTWQGDVETESWSAGPFSYRVAAPVPVRESYGGPARVFRAGRRTHVVWGPWQVVIKGIGAHAEHEVLGRWEIFRSWSANGWREVGKPGARLVGDPAALGASEQWLGGSEIRLGGASERFKIGASEIRLGGASERSFIAASELRLGGASGRSWGGASEIRLGGASERRLGGSSEERLGGASERQWGGASEGRLGGASEGRLDGTPPVAPEPVPSGAWPQLPAGPGTRS